MIQLASNVQFKEINVLSAMKDTLLKKDFVTGSATHLSSTTPLATRVLDVQTNVSTVLDPTKTNVYLAILLNSCSITDVWRTVPKDTITKARCA